MVLLHQMQQIYFLLQPICKVAQLPQIHATRGALVKNVDVNVYGVTTVFKMRSITIKVRGQSIVIQLEEKLNFFLIQTNF